MKSYFHNLPSQYFLFTQQCILLNLGVLKLNWIWFILGRHLSLLKVLNDWNILFPLVYGYNFILMTIQKWAPGPKNISIIIMWLIPKIQGTRFTLTILPAKEANICNKAQRIWWKRTVKKFHDVNKQNTLSHPWPR